MSTSRSTLAALKQGNRHKARLPLATHIGTLDDLQQQEEFDAIKDSKDLVVNRTHSITPDGTTHFVCGWYYPNGRAAIPQTMLVLLPTAPLAYEIRDTPDKGKGLFATRNIAFGEFIVVERPLIVLPLLLVTGWMSPTMIYSMLETLVTFHTQEDRELFLSLANCKGADMNKILGIISTNAIGLQLKGAKETYAAVCPVISRVNHSCGPNSYFSFDCKTFSMCLQATRDIPAFTEITATYCPLYLSRSERIEELKIKYNFTCKCPHCRKFSAKSDQIRNDMRRWSEIYPSCHKWMSDPERDASALLKSSLEGLATLTKEGIESEPLALLHYRDLVFMYGAQADAKNMRKWGLKLLLAFHLETDRRAELEVMVDYLMDPAHNFPHWGEAVTAR